MSVGEECQVIFMLNLLLLVEGVPRALCGRAPVFSPAQRAAVPAALSLRLPPLGMDNRQNLYAVAFFFCANNPPRMLAIPAHVQ